jgi:hypothetical protein
MFGFRVPGFRFRVRGGLWKLVAVCLWNGAVL